MMLSIFFMCLSATCMSSLENVWFFGPLFDCVACFSGIKLLEPLYILEINWQLICLLMFSPSWRLPFDLAYSFLHCAKAFNLIISHLLVFFSPLLWGKYHRGICCNLYHSVLPMFLSKSLSFGPYIYLFFINLF